MHLPEYSFRLFREIVEAAVEPQCGPDLHVFLTRTLDNRLRLCVERKCGKTVRKIAGERKLANAKRNSFLDATPNFHFGSAGAKRPHFSYQ